ncbi:hypothetical protein Fmac_002027 [Flemingia macrophylla]|uniref:Remorin C-terminal domain-containing protein n=1 Tax=Flemingia macrophylla TaxID=520843 RepID=A0ABD1NIS4_9FABA
MHHLESDSRIYQIDAPFGILATVWADAFSYLINCVSLHKIVQKDEKLEDLRSHDLCRTNTFASTNISISNNGQKFLKVLVQRVKKEEVDAKILTWQNTEVAKIKNRFNREYVINGWEIDVVQKASSWMKKVEEEFDSIFAQARFEAKSCVRGLEFSPMNPVQGERLCNQSWITPGGVTNKGRLYGVGKLGSILRLGDTLKNISFSHGNNQDSEKVFQL